MTASVAGRWTGAAPGWRSALAGLVAGVALLAVYLGVISIAQGPSHALEQLAADAWFVMAITAGFGVQIALFAELRAVNRRHRAGAAVTAAATGTSTAAMLACCAHHLVELVPLLGLSAAAVFLNDFKTPLMLLGLAMNATAIVVVLRALRRARLVCAMAGSTP
jgi:hypothetical protein